MPQQVEPAIPINLSSITHKHISRKLRVVGRVHTFDPSTSLLYITQSSFRVYPPSSSSTKNENTSTESILLIDLSLSLNPFTSYPYLNEFGSIVMIIGYLESFQAEWTSSEMILKAILCKEVRDLDLEVWEKSVREVEGINISRESRFPKIEYGNEHGRGRKLGV
ncbi:hypothetical protein C8Q75DRAFT_757245 [Abortiporus biennis]|nr:hypothetical protein C8Q75DRAFT_757245 [Abortiporus biennis]